MGAAGRQAPLLPGPLGHRQGLQRLAQPHVVGEDAAEPVVPEERQPLVAVELVVPQGGRQRRRGLGVRQLVEGQQRPHRPRPPLALVGDDAEGDQLLPQARLVAVDPQPVRFVVLQRPGLLDDAAQRVQLRARRG